jgi:L-lactate dehydrogenase complex protein LldG
MSARDDILRRLALAARTAYLPRTSAPAPPAVSEASVEECIARFSVEAAALGVECYFESSVTGVHERVTSVVGELPTLSWDLAELPYSVGTLLKNGCFADAPRETQAAALLGVTGCDAAIAETGSLVMFSTAGRPRTASLLPPVHLAVVTRGQLCFSMTEMFARHAPRLADSASCTVITGPSRTADIELTLTLGIHGPGRVIVVIGP